MSISGVAAYTIAEIMKIDDADLLHQLIAEHTSIDDFYRELKNLRSAYNALKSADTDQALREVLKPCFEEFAERALGLIQKHYVAANL